MTDADLDTLVTDGRNYSTLLTETNQPTPADVMWDLTDAVTALRADNARMRCSLEATAILLNLNTNDAPDPNNAKCIIIDAAKMAVLQALGDNYEPS
jgi:hypothetical protein